LLGISQEPIQYCKGYEAWGRAKAEAIAAGKEFRFLGIGSHMLLRFRRVGANVYSTPACPPTHSLRLNGTFGSGDFHQRYSAANDPPELT
jgi:hypothetical protein